MNNSLTPNSRSHNALVLLSLGNIHLLNSTARTFSVPSQKKNHPPYRVDLTHQTCECYDNSESHQHCKHLQAAALRERELNRFQLQAVPAKPAPRTYAEFFAARGLTF